jgi:SPP1 gp7 family putative phage head morphogenesis protein
MSFWRAVDKTIFRTATAKADDVREGLLKSVDVDAVAKSWLETHPAGGQTTWKEAKEWARVHLRFDNKELIQALKSVYATGYVLGQDVASQALELAKIQQKAPQIDFDWDNWEAGNREAEALVRPKGGLGRLLDRAGIMAQSLNATTMDRVGVKLADALNRGLGLSETAESLRSIVGDPTRAITIAATELSRAQNVATFDTYKESGVEQIEWMALDECEICGENVDASPINLGDEFPSGDTEPPAHPNCRCTIAPIIDTGEDLQGEKNAKAISPDFKRPAAVGVIGEMDMVRALNRLSILPNPPEPDIEEPEKFVESPWQVVEVPTIDPNKWDYAKIKVIQLDLLYGTDKFLSRKKVKKHIEAMGQALTPNRSYALVYLRDDKAMIIDGHHRLSALWLLGLDEAPVWLLED